MDLDGKMIQVDKYFSRIINATTAEITAVAIQTMMIFHLHSHSKTSKVVELNDAAFLLDSMQKDLRRQKYAKCASLLWNGQIQANPYFWTIHEDSRKYQIPASP